MEVMVVNSAWSPLWDLDERVNKFFKNSLVANSPYPMDLIELYDDKGELTGFELDIALAGIPKKNVKIETDKDNLVIEVKKTERDTKNRKYREIGIKRTDMTLKYVMSGIDKSKIDAEFTDGILAIKLPIATAAKPKSIIIK